jgi:hypothetical protein
MYGPDYSCNFYYPDQTRGRKLQWNALCDLRDSLVEACDIPLGSEFDAPQGCITEDVSVSFLLYSKIYYEILPIKMATTYGRWGRVGFTLPEFKIPHPDILGGIFFPRKKRLPENLGTFDI